MIEDSGTEISPPAELTGATTTVATFSAAMPDTLGATVKENTVVPIVVDAAVTSAPKNPVAEIPSSEATSAQIAVDLNVARRDAENAVHPVIKGWWHDFEGDVKSILIFVESELKKIV